jgi:MFS-type transporter involved in bile tolerance (Atg22 family)
MVMSHIFLSTAFIYLASEEVGCVEKVDGQMKTMESCEARVFGVFRPAALITNIAALSGLLSALFMPVAGAIMDYTSHRRTTGIVSAQILTLIQIIQIGISSSNWFAMAILQVFMGVFYHIQGMPL